MHGKYLVAVCDILGFSALVQSQPLDLVVKDALGWFSSALNHSIHRGMKDHEPMATLAVNWNRGIHAPTWRLRWSVTSDLPPEPNSVEEQSLYEKYLNTKHFHEAHCHDCKRT